MCSAIIQSMLLLDTFSSLQHCILTIMLQVPPVKHESSLYEPYCFGLLDYRYGFVSDSFPIRGMRRRPYLIIAGICGTLSWLALAGIAQACGIESERVLLSSTTCKKHSACGYCGHMMTGHIMTCKQSYVT